MSSKLELARLKRAAEKRFRAQGLARRAAETKVALATIDELRRAAKPTLIDRLRGLA